MTTKILFVGSLLLSSAASGQSLFAEDPNEEQNEPLPLKFTATAGIGYDDSFTSSSASAPTSSAYVNAALGANYVNYTPRTSWKIGANISASKYLKGNSGNNGVYYNGRIRMALNHRLTARTRYVQNTYVNYGIEPNYSFSFTPNRTPSEHLFYSTDHAIGHRWTTRFATYTGVRVSGVNYHGSGGVDQSNDRRTFAFYNDFRYATAPNTTLVARVEYQKTDANGSAGDSTNIIGSLGVEHQISRNSYAFAQIGATHRGVKGGRSDYFSPYVYGAYNANLNAKTKLKIYARYGVEDYGTSQGVVTYDTNQSIRVGAELNYLISPKLSLQTGVNFIRYDYSDGRNVVTNTKVRDNDQQLINPYVGFNYEINPRTSVNGSYHYNNSSSSFTNASSRDYKRNRFQLGVSRVF